MKRNSEYLWATCILIIFVGIAVGIWRYQQGVESARLISSSENNARVAGFASVAEMDAMKKKGYNTRTEFEDAEAQVLGFSNQSERRTGELYGYKTGAEFSAAQKKASELGFSTISEMSTLQSKGYNTKAEYVEAERIREKLRQEEIAAYNMQKYFVAIIISTKSLYFNKTGNPINDRESMTQAAISRGHSLCDLLPPQLEIQEWTGYIAEMDTISSANNFVSLKVTLHRGEHTISLQTDHWLYDRTKWALIPLSGDVGENLRKLKIGSYVKFSGNFFRAGNDSVTPCIQELSITREGAMKTPEFLFRFTNIRDANLTRPR